MNGNAKETTSWETCSEIAKSALDGTFVPVDSHWNAYYNPNKANPSWASQLADAKLVGKHRVGELFSITKSVYGLKKKKKLNIHVVKKGETLWSIAGKDMKKVD